MSDDDLGGLGDGGSKDIGHHGQHTGVHLRRNDGSAKQVDKAQNGDLGQAVGKVFTSRGKPDAQQLFEQVFGKGAQCAQRDVAAHILAEHAVQHEYADSA